MSQQVTTVSAGITIKTTVVALPVLRDFDDWVVIAKDPYEHVHVLWSFDRQGRQGDLRDIDIRMLDHDQEGLSAFEELGPHDLAVAEIVRSAKANTALVRVFAIASASLARDQAVVDMAARAPRACLSQLLQQLKASLGSTGHAEPTCS